MIGYIEGKLLQKEKERILVLANQVGYEILLPAIVMASLIEKAIGDEVALFIYYQQTERQPKPVLIGFNQEAEKEFFQLFLSVAAIGPLKAAKAMTLPVGEIARSIESRDVPALKGLSGIGTRTAQKIIATLEGKLDKFMLDDQPTQKVPAPGEDFARQVLEVMTEQLGHRPADARQMIAAALKRNETIATAEELFDEIYRGEVSHD
ncbi:MAG: Holliday junction DNA helicase RuvA [Desulfobacterales bacterium]|nr:Holliday junction DNA helicase RuvA [Desulfobacterales bacterium]